MMYQYLFIFIFVATSALFSVSKVSEIEKAKQEYMDRFDPRDYINISIFYPVSTNTSPEQITFLNMSLFYSYVLNSKIDISSGVSSSFDAPYIQVTALGNYNSNFYHKYYHDRIKKESLLLHISGLFNYTKNPREDNYGFQISGISNTVSSLNGIQLSSLYNRSGKIIGAQVAPIINMSEIAKCLQLSLINAAVQVKGVQIGGLTNVALEELSFGSQICFGVNYSKLSLNKSVQIAGLCNYGRSSGLQFSLSNISHSKLDRRKRVKGGKQIGLCNLADNDSIFQLGLINFRGISGRQIGLINLATDNKTKTGIFNISKTSRFRYNLLTDISNCAEINTEVLNDNTYTGISSSFFYDEDLSNLSIGVYKGLKVMYKDIDFLCDLGLKYYFNSIECHGFTSKITTNFSKYNLPTNYSKKQKRSAYSFIGIGVNYKYDNFFKFNKDYLTVHFIYGMSFMF